VQGKIKQKFRENGNFYQAQSALAFGVTLKQITVDI